MPPYRPTSRPGSSPSLAGAGGDQEESADQWVQIPGNLSDVGAAADGSVWGVTRNGNIHRYTGDRQDGPDRQSERAPVVVQAGARLTLPTAHGRWCWSVGGRRHAAGVVMTLPDVRFCRCLSAEGAGGRCARRGTVVPVLCPCVPWARQGRHHLVTALFSRSPQQAGC
ncbi:hypothetical protein OG810_35355 [Streptomyces sp. NBC_01693]|uniref:tectonin domain-containing protein n=1 Tax=unclassified Streptomyces TaxID=2593676 RepID=UPI002E2A0BA5|nr:MULTISPECIES: tectonin domain-containing protein [unclassified Streptomyces]